MGASCYLYEFPQGNLLIDCGLRQSTSPASPPDLKLLSSRPDWMILTHAHLDHVGALPQIIKMFPSLQVHATVETCAMARIVLEDAAQISESEGGALTKNEVEAALRQLRPFQKGRVLNLTSSSGEISVATRSAGHLIGAVSLRIQAGLLMIEHTGDVSLENTPTTDGAILGRSGAHVTVCESTYGNRDLPPRRHQVSEMIKTTREILSNKGRILIPSFALGRAQDVSYHLNKAMEQGLLPRVPIYVDGMCREAARVAEKLAPSLPANTRTTSSTPFTGNGITLVSGRDREKIIKNAKPAIIIASSGMLSGGVSPIYALKISQEDQSAIMLVGYQEAESPGGQLRQARRGDQVRLGGKTIKLRCNIHQVQLSGHADKNDLKKIVDATGAHTVVLLHGDQQARDGLARLLRSSGNRDVLTPENKARTLLSMHRAGNAPRIAVERPKPELTAKQDWPTPVQVQKEAQTKAAQESREKKPLQAKQSKAKAQEQDQARLTVLEGESRKEAIERSLREQRRIREAIARIVEEERGKVVRGLQDPPIQEKPAPTANSNPTPQRKNSGIQKPAPVKQGVPNQRPQQGTPRGQKLSPETRAEIKRARALGLPEDARSRRRQRRAMMRAQNTGTELPIETALPETDND